MDGPRSLIFEQSENRLHVQKALLGRSLIGDDHRRGMSDAALRALQGAPSARPRRGAPRGRQRRGASPRTARRPGSPRTGHCRSSASAASCAGSARRPRPWPPIDAALERAPDRRGRPARPGRDRWSRPATGSGPPRPSTAWPPRSTRAAGCPRPPMPPAAPSSSPSRAARRATTVRAGTPIGWRDAPATHRERGPRPRAGDRAERPCSTPTTSTETAAPPSREPAPIDPTAALDGRGRRPPSSAGDVGDATDPRAGPRRGARPSCRRPAARRHRRLLPGPGRRARPTRACTWRSPSCTSTAAGDARRRQARPARPAGRARPTTATTRTRLCALVAGRLPDEPRLAALCA